MIRQFGIPREETKVVKQFDKDGDKRLSKEERSDARAWLKENKPRRGPGMTRVGRGGPGGPGGQAGQSIPPGQGGPGALGGQGGPVLFGPGGGERREPPTRGIPVKPADVQPSGVPGLYAPGVVRTFFLDFEDRDWAAEMADFHDTDVDLPATLTVDGEVFKDVGVHFRGASSFMMVPEGRKRSLNVSLDFVHKKQRLDGYKTLNLLNGNGDPSQMSAALFAEIAQSYIPAAKANFVRVVINGENWGIFTSLQQINKDFMQEHFRSGKGARWKVPGSPNGQGGLEYLGDNIAEYRKRYDIKSEDNEEDWRALIELCRVLKETPADKLEDALKPIANVDNLLWFLALDCTLMNSDGYWIRASDYYIVRDAAGKFHFVPGDMNEAFTTMHGPGGGGMRLTRANNPPDNFDRSASGRREGGFVNEPDAGEARFERPQAPPQPSGSGEAASLEKSDPPKPVPPGGSAIPTEAGPRQFGPPGGFPRMPKIDGVKLDPLVGLDDEKKPLRSRALAVPSLRERYLKNVRTIAEEWLDWAKLGPVVAKHRALLEPHIAVETRGLARIEDFRRVTADTPQQTAAPAEGERNRQRMSVREFADQRRAYLLSLPVIKELSK